MTNVIGKVEKLYGRVNNSTTAINVKGSMKPQRLTKKRRKKLKKIKGLRKGLSKSFFGSTDEILDI